MVTLDQQTQVIQGLSGRRAAVIGLGVSNVPLIRFLVRCQMSVRAYDRKREEDLDSAIRSLEGCGVEFSLGTDTIQGLRDFDMAFVSPGVRPDREEFREAREAGVEFCSEIQLLFRLALAPIIGITGSSGKTTTTTLTGLILEEDYRSRAGRKVYVGGNIGQPLIEKILDIRADDIIVLELSSFQLKPLRQSPNIGMVLNVTPNHLDIHPDMDDYIWSKENIIRHQAPGDTAILGADNAITREMAGRAPHGLMTFSAISPVERGAFLQGNTLILRDGRDTAVLDRRELRIPGMHNVENALAAICASHAAGASADSMRKAITDFHGVEHRLEKVREVDGIAFINDSIATSPARTIAALNALESPIVLIAGGYDKHLPFDDMAELTLDKVKAAVLIGVTASKIEASIRAAATRRGVDPPILVRRESFEEAVRTAGDMASAGDTVLLSPACASYDMFSNFEERGRLFKALVQAL